MANEEYKFPDEQDVTPDIEIDIEEDTPEEDRGRQPMPKEIVQKLDSDDDELADYDETVKQKLKQLKKVWHDERREKEAALREHNEAVALARQLLEENQRIKGDISLNVVRVEVGDNLWQFRPREIRRPQPCVEGAGNRLRSTQHRPDPRTERLVVLLTHPAPPPAAPAAVAPQRAGH